MHRHRLARQMPFKAVLQLVSEIAKTHLPFPPSAEQQATSFNSFFQSPPIFRLTVYRRGVLYVGEGGGEATFAEDSKGRMKTNIGVSLE